MTALAFGNALRPYLSEHTELDQDDAGVTLRVWPEDALLRIEMRPNGRRGACMQIESCATPDGPAIDRIRVAPNLDRLPIVAAQIRRKLLTREYMLARNHATREELRQQRAEALRERLVDYAGSELAWVRDGSDLVAVMDGVRFKVEVTYVSA
jgi:hypothetical protein